MFKNINMKKLILILSLVVVVSFSLAAITSFLTRSFSIGRNTATPNIQSQEKGSIGGTVSREINEEKTFDIDGLKQIDIEAVSSNINIIPTTDGTTLKAHFHGTVSTSSENYIPYLDASSSGDRIKLSIKRKSNNIVGFINENTALDVYVPKAYRQAMDIRNVSGTTKIDTLEHTDFRFTSVSGNLIAKSLVGNTADLGSTSGDMQITHLDVRTLNQKSVSGKITIENCKTEDSTLKTTSGNIRLENSQGNMDLESISGDLNVSYASFNHDIKAKTTSGKVSIKLPKTASFAIETDTVSGNFISDFPITLTGSVNKKSISGRVGDSSHKVSIRTVSGDIQLHPIK